MVMLTIPVSGTPTLERYDTPVSSNLIPVSVARMIRAEGSFSDGDIWRLGDGRFAEYDYSRSLFLIKEKGEVIGEVTLRAVLHSGGDR